MYWAYGHRILKAARIIRGGEKSLPCIHHEFWVRSPIPSSAISFKAGPPGSPSQLESDDTSVRWRRQSLRLDVFSCDSV